jgi:2-polyprenyl-3-methyl-5-hydroxy-6-metoxy-1,4-benzoquinol methylase
VALLRCLRCRGVLQRVSDRQGECLACTSCNARYPVAGGVPRLLRETTEDDKPRRIKMATAASFAYEWKQFGQLRPEWRKNFLDYMQPYGPEDLAGRTVLDAGAGSGRHSRQAADLGASVVAVELGDAVDVARANLPSSALAIQADLEDLPLAYDAFDFVLSIGVLHHLPATEQALSGLVPHARPGGVVQTYLYWSPERRWHRALLSIVTAARRITTRLPPRLLHLLSYPIAAAVYAAFVLPYRALRRFRATRPLARGLPLKTYADYPFMVCVNDQFDRFSAPLERRFTEQEVRAMMYSAGLEEVVVTPNNGWVASGKRPPGPR